METFEPYIAPRVPGCPSVLIERKVLEAVRDYCKDGWVYRKTEEYTAAVDDTDKVLTPDADAEIIEEIQVSKEGSVFSAYEFAAGTITYDNAITVEADFKIIFAQRPEIDVDSLPAIFLSNHKEAIIQKTLSLFYLMKTQVWYDPNLYKEAEKKYYSELAKFRAKIMVKNNMMNSSVKLRKFV